jgi:hypothetical protein
MIEIVQQIILVILFILNKPRGASSLQDYHLLLSI